MPPKCRWCAAASWRAAQAPLLPPCSSAHRAAYPPHPVTTALPSSGRGAALGGAPAPVLCPQSDRRVPTHSETPAASQSLAPFGRRVPLLAEPLLLHFLWYELTYDIRRFDMQNLGFSTIFATVPCCLATVGGASNFPTRCARRRPPWALLPSSQLPQNCVDAYQLPRQFLFLSTCPCLLFFPVPNNLFRASLPVHSPHQVPSGPLQGRHPVRSKSPA